MLSVDDAKAKILSAIQPLPPQTTALTSLALASNTRFLAATVRSTRALPPFHNSAMDGYAVGPGLVAAPTSLKLVGASLAGHGTDVVVGAGECVAITTGAPIPKGAVAVVMRERCDASTANAGHITVAHVPAPGEHIRQRGEDIDAGDVVGDVGTALTPARLNLLWSAGLVEASVYRAPTVAIMASGDELKEVGSTLTDDDVVNSNAWAIAAACARLGCRVKLLGIAADTLEDHHRRLVAGRDEFDGDHVDTGGADVVISIGGVSVGSHDFVRPALQAMGAELSLWRVAMRPGKPLAFGALPRAKGAAAHFFGLPGNPVSAMVTFRLFVQPALRRLAGAPLHTVDDDLLRATLCDETPFKKKVGLTFFARAQTSTRNGALEVRTLDRQGSGQISGLAAANALMVVPADVDVVNAGDTVDVLPL
jgi:molybdopterin molybdotransferase